MTVELDEERGPQVILVVYNMLRSPRLDLV